MNRNEIIENVKAFETTVGIGVDEMVVGYEAAAVMHGLRETSSDIDVDVHREDLEKIAEEMFTNRGKSITGEFVTIGRIDLHIGEHNEDYELIDGIWVVGQKTLLRQYREMFYHPNRPAERRKKDLCIIKSLTTKH